MTGRHVLRLTESALSVMLDLRAQLDRARAERDDLRVQVAQLTYALRDAERRADDLQRQLERRDS